MNPRVSTVRLVDVAYVHADGEGSSPAEIIFGDDGGAAVFDLWVQCKVAIIFSW